MSLNDITSVDIGRQSSKRVGRGLGSGLGKTGGRGSKGEGSRTGGKNRGPMFEGGQKPLWMRIPKRGFSNFVHKNRFQAVRLDVVLKLVAGATIDAEVLTEAGLVRGDTPIKLVGGRGEVKIERKLTVKLDKVSASVKQAIEAAGGSVTETQPAPAAGE
ncbi:MAG: 50S ribosomal protein L15 [Planctomycetes bacterium]|nr:50S ribosomal protein L15 [Planctomycetota bacterium]